VGDLTNDPALHDKGVADEAVGLTKDAFGHAKRKVGEADRNVEKTIKR
jgi:uncharacterized protein YjbJ (UPF0337 family)